MVILGSFGVLFIPGRNLLTSMSAEVMTCAQAIQVSEKPSVKLRRLIGGFDDRRACRLLMRLLWVR